MVLYYKIQEKGNDMNVYVVTAEYGHYKEMEDNGIIGVYSNLALAGRAAIANFFDIVKEPLECIRSIDNTTPDVMWEFWGEDEREESYQLVTILKVMLDD